MANTPRRRVAIIGTGASGLPAIRHALLYDCVPVAFEQAGDIGGLWRYKEQETSESSVMKSTVINTCKEMTAYSDFPPPHSSANFMHNTKMLQYLRDYAQHFDLIQYIRFHHRVLNVQRSSTYAKTGKWIVVFLDPLVFLSFSSSSSSREGVEQREEFDGILLATGHHTEPYWPTPWPGQETFKGTIIHSHSYKDHRGYEDKIIVVVGVGNSGGDIAVELSRIAKQVYLVTRRGTWVVNRIFGYGEPVDLAVNRRFLYKARYTFPESLANWYMERQLNFRFDHATYGGFRAHPTVNDELPNRIACGTVIVKPNIKAFTERGLIFEDDTRLDDVDEVVISTGYSFHFPMAEEGNLIPVKENQVELYQYMFPPTLADHNSLAVLGLIQPLGSIMPISEMQARVFLDVLTGHSQLPSASEMRENIEKKRETMARRYVKSRRHTIQVDYMHYMDELAELIGARPDLWSLATSGHLKLALKCLFGPNVPYQYRLNGPHAWPGAAEAIALVDARVLAATQTRRPSAIIKKEGSYLMAMVGVLVLLFVYFFVF